MNLVKAKELAKKGGVESIIGIIVLVALVIILIIAVVIPLVNDASEAGNETVSDTNTAYNAIDGIRDDISTNNGIN